MTTQKGTLNEIDLDKIARLIDLRFELKAKDEIKKIIAEEFGKLPSKDEFYESMGKLLKAVEKKENDELIHSDIHKTLGKDATTLKQQVKHLYDTLEIEAPVNPAF